MYLKALEIQGFKSFPEKTVISFEKDITAIVGPNGSGKSNISDALLWVMGEQRSKALRGGKMEDVIFGGTEKRSPLGFAQVSLVLDNSKGTFSIDTQEVTITRRYYRTGESEYYLNREAVRLKDITGLLMDTGLGRDGYSVIGQGRISEIVSVKSTDRREIFEEAAGIARFRFRKEEAERKLERTEDNLLRVNDKIDELEMQVEPLQKQAETAKKFLVFRDEQRTLEISAWMETLDRLHVQSETVNSEFSAAQAELDKANEELRNIYAAAEQFSVRMQEYDVESEAVRASQAECESAAAECESAAAVLRTNLQHNAENIERLKSEMDEQTDRTENIRRQAQEQERRIDDIGVLLAENTLAIRGVQQETERNAAASDDARQGLAAMVSKENELSDGITKCATTLTLLQDRSEELCERRNSIGADIDAAEQKYNEITAALHAAEKEYDTAKTRVDEINNVINGHRMLLSSRESAVKELTDKLNSLTVEKRSAEGRIHMLSEMEKEFEGMGKAVKSVMQSSARGTLRGVHGPVAGLLSVDERYAIAVETALGAAMQNIVVDNQDCGKAAIEMLKRSDGGRATFLPLDTVRPGAAQKPLTGEPGYLGIASELVKYDSRYKGIFENLLGRTVVAETLGDAVKMSRKYENRIRIVTLDGQMINAGGSMTGGSAARNVGILSRANELKTLRARLEELEVRVQECSGNLAEAERVLSGAKYEAEVAASELSGASETLHKAESGVSQYRLMRTAIDENLEDLEREKNGLASGLRENEQRIAATAQEQKTLETALAQLREEIRRQTAGSEDFEKQREALGERLAALRAESASLEAERESARRAVASLNELIATLSGDGEERKNRIAELERQESALQTQLAEMEKNIEARRQQAEGYRSRIAEITAVRLEMEGRRTRNDKLGQDKNREILDLQAACSRCEQKKLSAEMEEKQILDKLWDSYELSRTAAQALRQPVESMSAATKRISELRREISKLGTVNVGAIEEYDRVSERYNFLTEQRDDVEKAKRDLQKIISDITGEMKEIFVREFTAIDESFRTVFLELFGGGKAQLILEDPDDPLGCGIEIKVQPPGKAVTTISLLSGGEKSFVAIALYFAIMKVRPTPFCIMDEIDAALDEANVERYAGYMRSMIGETQFIVITHHRATMEEADMLYGVTMQEKGVTTVLSVDLDEAEKTIN
ncbi:MAG: chromosome segregation protein SMC [Ruminococcaceae bacterium]|nr:chromosome segregation protein SMC [Oscillospiraceae bacterium]